MWNDTDTPLAHLITFRYYGTWLHGDGRGSVDRRNNVYGTPYIEPNANWKSYNEGEMLSEPLYLNASKRKIVEDAIREVCTNRNWGLYAVNVRTNHVHTVVCCGSSKSALRTFKSYATRRLKEAGFWTYDHSPWARKGSRPKLWNERSVEQAVDYVINGQGNDLPTFEQ